MCSTSFKSPSVRVIAAWQPWPAFQRSAGARAGQIDLREATAEALETAAVGERAELLHLEALDEVEEELGRVGLEEHVELIAAHFRAATVRVLDRLVQVLVHELQKTSGGECDLSERIRVRESRT
jgi:hypothetical protein